MRHSGQPSNCRSASFPWWPFSCARIKKTTQRTIAGAFKLYRDFLALEGGLKGSQAGDEPHASRRNRFNIRELIMLQKIAASWDCTDVIREAMSIFGGHGVMEDFSALPRLYRDSAINELWEGPRNVLLTQIHRDLQQAAAWYPPEEFVANILQGLDQALIDELAAEIKAIVAHPHLFQMDDVTIDICRALGCFLPQVFPCLPGPGPGRLYRNHNFVILYKRSAIRNPVFSVSSGYQPAPA